MDDMRTFRINITTEKELIVDEVVEILNVIIKSMKEMVRIIANITCNDVIMKLSHKYNYQDYQAVFGLSVKSNRDKVEEFYDVFLSHYIRLTECKTKDDVFVAVCEFKEFFEKVVGVSVGGSYFDEVFKRSWDVVGCVNNKESFHVKIVRGWSSISSKIFSKDGNTGKEISSKRVYGNGGQGLLFENDSVLGQESVKELELCFDNLKKGVGIYIIDPQNGRKYKVSDNVKEKVKKYLKKNTPFGGISCKIAYNKLNVIEVVDLDI